MTSGPGDPLSRASARALLVDPTGRLVLLRRTRPGVPPYLVTPGGGVEAGETVVAALVRECREELGAEVVPGPVVLDLAPAGGHGRQTVLLARLVARDPGAATGAELGDPARGGYAVVLVDPADDAALEPLVPVALRTLVRDHGPALVARAAALSR